MVAGGVICSFPTHMGQTVGLLVVGLGLAKSVGLRLRSVAITTQRSSM